MASNTCKCKCHKNTDHWKQCNKCFKNECAWYKNHSDIYVEHCEKFLEAFFGKRAILK